MALVLTEEQSMLRDSARGLISDKAPVSHLRSLRDAKDTVGFSRDLWKTFAEMGFSGLLVPENFGGSGLGCVEAGVVMEEIGRTLMPSPFFATSVLAASGSRQHGRGEKRRRHQGAADFLHHHAGLDAAEPAATKILRHQQPGKSHLGKRLPEIPGKPDCVLGIAQAS